MTFADIGAMSGVFGLTSCAGGVFTVAAAAEARVVMVGFVLGWRHVCELLSWSRSDSPFFESSSSSLNSMLSNRDFFSFSGSLFFGVSFGFGGSSFGVSSSAAFCCCCFLVCLLRCSLGLGCGVWLAMDFGSFKRRGWYSVSSIRVPSSMQSGTQSGVTIMMSSSFSKAHLYLA